MKYNTFATLAIASFLAVASTLPSTTAFVLPYCAAINGQSPSFLLVRKSEPVDLPPVSEEANDGATCPSDQVMAGAQCSGRYCDNLTVKCAPITDDFQLQYAQVEVDEFGPETTDGLPAAFCPAEKAVVGIKCTGRYCDNVHLRCASLEVSTPASQGAVIPVARVVFAQSEADGCSWTPEFTDGGSAQLCPATQFARGIECKGRYCDNMRVYCCPAKVTACNPTTMQ